MTNGNTHQLKGDDSMSTIKKYLVVIFTIIATILITQVWQFKEVSLINLEKEKEQIKHEKLEVIYSLNLPSSATNEAIAKVANDYAKIRISQLDLRIAQINRDLKFQTMLFATTILILVACLLIVFVFTRSHCRSDNNEHTERVDKF